MTNLLKNGGFEADWGDEQSHHCIVITDDGIVEKDIPNIFTPPGWVTWFVHKPGTWDQPEVRDAWKDNDPNRVHSGEKGILFFTFFRRHKGGFLQQVQVTPGQPLRLNAYAHAWSNHPIDGYEWCTDDGRCSCGVGKVDAFVLEGNAPEPSGDPWLDAISNFTFRVGIDPTGGTDPTSANIVWGADAHIYNTHALVPSVEVVAQSGTITVFLRSKTAWGFKHNDAYWDDASLVIVSEPSSEPAPSPSPSPSLPPEPEELSDRGQPRVQYKRTYVLLPPDATIEWVQAVAEQSWNYRYTIGASADDSGIGDLDNRRIIAVNPVRWVDDLENFFKTYYPGVSYIAVEANSPDSLVLPGPDEWPDPIWPDDPDNDGDPGEPSPSEPPYEPQSSKLGPHVLRAATGVTEYSLVAPIVKQVDAFDANVNPGSLVIGRHYNDYDAQSQYNHGLSPREAASKFVNDQKEQYLLNPHIKYWEGHNEPVWSTLEEMNWYALFEIERIKLMNDLGLKCIIGNFSTGAPPLELWPAFLPAIEFGLEHEAILGLHEYSCPWMWWMTGDYQIDPSEDQGDEGWTTLRYRKVYRQYLIPNNLVIPLAITECGIDPLVGPLPPGAPAGTWSQLGGFWASYTGEVEIPWTGDKASYYAAQLKWYTEELRKDPFVIGATIFCMGHYDDNWADFDIAGTAVTPLLIQYANEYPASDPFNWEDYATYDEQPDDSNNEVTLSIPGLHDYPGGIALAQAGARGACCLVHITVSDRPVDLDLRPLTSAGIQPIVRICRGYADGTGTVPSESEAEAWCDYTAQTINNIQWGDYDWVQKLVVIFNEENNPVEWPGSYPNPTTIVTPGYVASLYNRIAQSVEPTTKLCPGVVDPYNVVAGEFNVVNDPKLWFTYKWNNCPRIDWIAVHAKTQTSNVEEINGEASYAVFSDAPLIGRYMHLRTVEDQLDWILEVSNSVEWTQLPIPIFITELNPQRKLDGVTLGWDTNKVEWITAASSYLDTLLPVAGWTLYRWEKAGDQANFGLCDSPEVIAWIKAQLD